MSDKERRITAYHEAGHAILFHVLPDVGPVYSVSIVPTGGAGRLYDASAGERTRCSTQRGMMLQEITVVTWRPCGGRAEVFDDVTTGASQDIKQATAIARAMVTKLWYVGTSSG